MKESLRKKVLKRDNYRCVYCGSTENLQVDHKIPRKYGGNDHFENLVTACQVCNIRKSAKLEDNLKEQVISISEWKKGHFFETEQKTKVEYIVRDSSENLEYLKPLVKQLQGFLEYNNKTWEKISEDWSLMYDQLQKQYEDLSKDYIVLLNKLYPTKQ